MEMVRVLFRALPHLGSAPRQQRPHPWSLGSQYHHLALGIEIIEIIESYPFGNPEIPFVFVRKHEKEGGRWMDIYFPNSTS